MVANAMSALGSHSPLRPPHERIDRGKKMSLPPGRLQVIELVRTATSFPFFCGRDGRGLRGPKHFERSVVTASTGSAVVANLSHPTAKQQELRCRPDLRLQLRGPWSLS